MKTFMVFKDGKAVSRYTLNQDEPNELTDGRVMLECDAQLDDVYFDGGIKVKTENTAVINGNILSNINLPAKLETGYGTFDLTDNTLVINVPVDSFVLLKPLKEKEKIFKVTI